MKILNALKHEDHRRALFATLIYIMLNILFFLLVSMEEPDPPLKEVVIPIEMENIVIPEEFIMDDPGGGGSQGGPSPIDEQVQHSAAEETTQQEESVYVPSGSQNETETGVNNQPQPDQSLGFNGNGGNDNGNGTGTGFGDGEGTNTGDGSGPNGYGNSNLNRKRVSDPAVNGNAQEEGIIALDIWVDENGNVVQVRYKESKSTSGSQYLIDLATRGAKGMKYEKKPGATKEYVGYMRFEFTKI